MQSGKNIVALGLVGAVLGAIIGLVLTYLDYTYFFTGGWRAMGDQIYPICALAVVIGGMMGALAAAGWVIASGGEGG